MHCNSLDLSYSLCKDAPEDASSMVDPASLAILHRLRWVEQIKSCTGLPAFVWWHLDELYTGGNRERMLRVVRGKQANPHLFLGILYAIKLIEGFLCLCAGQCLDRNWCPWDRCQWRLAVARSSAPIELKSPSWRGASNGKWRMCWRRASASRRPWSVK